MSPSAPMHPIPVLVERPQIQLPAAPGKKTGDVVKGDIVSISIATQTIVTIFGVVTADWSQKVKAELLDPTTLDSQAIITLDGQSRESLLVDSTSNKTITWGPFDKEMSVELTFYHKKDTVWTLSNIKYNKMKEFVADDLKTAISLIPVDDGGHGLQDYQNTTLNVSRMTLF
ncbi:hypothetical protein B0H16DRAFT_1595892 [Mycena metata]|uniref:Uncharacterized protein n=1 Tax=Mycena metata TaxID=1033252 RepID=A0AAD7HNE5_9AGAR|nr:hypothetical protein B0H16DRAFT_1595883 [Mycena metata]KAJ7724656.1 hypothetical protein B0H16DRAFT_1595892 [Mycena metata]